MKPTQILMCAMAVGAMIFAAGKASAVLGVVNVSGTTLSKTDSNPSPGVFVGKVTQQGFKTKDVLKLLADGTTTWFGGDQTWFTDIHSQLVYDPDAFNAVATSNYTFAVFGIFYVTNTSTHNVYRLDGFDGEFYYSFVEFDSYGFDTLTGNGLGFWHDPGLAENFVESYKENDNTGTFSSTTTLHGLLYIHDEPYDNNITDFPSFVFDNNNAMVIRGLGTFNFSDNSTTQTEFFTLSGSGDGLLNGTNVVIQGKMTFKAQGPSNVPM